LEGIVRHHLDPAGMRAVWTPDLAALPKVPWLEPIDFVIQSDRLEMARQADKLDIKPVHLSQGEIADIVTFLHSFTGERAKKGRLGRPDSVPSGLRVD
jgi:cytochrome c peroxidase